MVNARGIQENHGEGIRIEERGTSTRSASSLLVGGDKMKLTRNFDSEEFKCKCGCGLNNVSMVLVELLQKVRDEIGVALRVNSGCRCERHNARVGGVRNSQHLKGVAADVSCEKGGKRIYEVVKELDAEGKIPEMKYCILYEKKNFVHIDVGKLRSKKYELRG